MNHKDYLRALENARKLDADSVSSVPRNEIKCMQDYIADLEFGHLMMKLICGVFAIGFILVVVSEIAQMT